MIVSCREIRRGFAQLLLSLVEILAVETVSWAKVGHAIAG